MSSQRMLDRIRHDKRIWAHRVLTKHDQNPFFRVMKSVNAPVVDVEDRSVIMLGSNNYLGLADHPLVRRAHAALGRQGGADTTIYYARRCVYRRRQGLLLVTEVFLPSVLDLKPTATQQNTK